MTEYKEVTWKSLKPGCEINKFREGNRTTFANAIVKEVNVAYVVLSIFGKYEERVSSEGTMFGIPLTKQEFRKKYWNEAKEIVKALSVRIPEYSVGYHEMDNAWLDSDIYEMAKKCRDRKIKVIGRVDGIIPKRSWAGLVLDAGICCEEENGKRFWCHVESSFIEKIIYKYSYLLEDV